LIAESLNADFREELVKFLVPLAALVSLGLSQLKNLPAAFRYRFDRYCLMSVWLVVRANNFLAADNQLCDIYVMRSTQNVVVAEEDTGMGHYSDPPLLVLASLANGPKHGHAMIEDIARLCGTRLGPGTLYGAIGRLEQLGWIEPLPPEERRRPYRITAEGLHVLRARLTTLQQFAKAGLGRLEPL
jgi:DNA-binding PadR family transcriptional regulator